MYGYFPYKFLSLHGCAQADRRHMVIGVALSPASMDMVHIYIFNLGSCLTGKQIQFFFLPKTVGARIEENAGDAHSLSSVLRKLTCDPAFTWALSKIQSIYWKWGERKSRDRPLILCKLLPPSHWFFCSLYFMCSQVLWMQGVGPVCILITASC